MTFIMWRNFPSIPSIFRAFSTSIEIDAFASIYMLYYIFRFLYAEPSLHSSNETNLVMLYDDFDMLLNSACQYLVENLCVCIH
jgi:hypothetical protein